MKCTSFWFLLYKNKEGIKNYIFFINYKITILEKELSSRHNNHDKENRIEIILILFS